MRSGQNTVGYWRLPEETASQLTPDGWLRTGDAAWRDEEGYLYLHDRIKDLIISGGENIYPAEVENALAANPAVGDVAVIGVPVAAVGRDAKAVVVPAPGATIDRTRCSPTSGPAWPATSARRRSTSSTRCPATPPGRSCGGSCGRPTRARERERSAAMNSSNISKRRAAALDEGGAAYQGRRAEIIRAAGEVFKRLGFRGTKIGDIAEAVGMDRATIYYYVGGKEELFHQAVGDAVERNCLRAEAILTGPGTPAEKLRRWSPT